MMKLLLGRLRWSWKRGQSVRIQTFKVIMGYVMNWWNFCPPPTHVTLGIHGIHEDRYSHSTFGLPIDKCKIFPINTLASVRRSLYCENFTVDSLYGCPYYKVALKIEKFRSYVLSRPAYKCDWLTRIIRLSPVNYWNIFPLQIEESNLTLYHTKMMVKTTCLIRALLFFAGKRATFGIEGNGWHAAFLTCQSSREKAKKEWRICLLPIIRIMPVQ